MTEHEKLALDEFCANHVMGGRARMPFHPTVDGADAMEVLAECGRKLSGPVSICCMRADENRSGKESYWIHWSETETESLPLTICLFAQRLHSAK